MKALILDNPKEHDKPAEFLAHAAKREGYEVKKVKNRTQALSKLESNCFDVVIIHHSGFKDLYSLKAEYPNLKYFAYSGYYSECAKTNKSSFWHAFSIALDKRYDFASCDYFELVKALEDLKKDEDKK